MNWNLLLFVFASLLTVGSVRNVFRSPQSKRRKIIALFRRRPTVLYRQTIPPISHELQPGGDPKLATDRNHVIAFLTLTDSFARLAHDSSFPNFKFKSSSR
jgi:hypothetical protein